MELINNVSLSGWLLSKVNQDTHGDNNAKHLGKIKFKNNCCPKPVVQLVSM